MSFIEAISLGVVQGLTEFLPVSSSGHLALAQHYLGLREPQLFFDVMVHVGTLMAILLAFREDVLRILRGKDWYLFGMICLGTVPTAVIGFTLRRFVEEAMIRVWIVSAMLLVTGIVLISSSLIARKAIKKLDRVTPLRSLAVGVAQGVAVIPGISRSGMTISSALALGVKGEEAARFSFLLSIPAILGAALLEVKDIGANEIQIAPTLSGMIAAFISGFIAIKLLISMLRRGRYTVFGYYCVAIAFLSLLLNLLFNL
ncbi:undecaprenyl-diphosphate phosphatase [Candidatus Poribacteria bacterium]|nr:undecaprenyl-diphosphate phosphatase [Candidatus Poribacteria bacterium]